jgi:hypothetical protein
MAVLALSASLGALLTLERAATSVAMWLCSAWAWVLLQCLYSNARRIAAQLYALDSHAT